MYGGSAYAYTIDPAFMWISTSEKFWQKLIDKFYDRYMGFAKWHEEIVSKATRDGQLVMPTGRIYKYELEKGWNGEFKAPITKIKNYPVQGLGADIMAIARVSFFKRWNDCGDINGVLINTVHDSIVCDIHSSEVERVRGIYMDVFKALPDNFRRVFGVEFNLPLLCEVKVGHNMLELEEI